MGHDLSEFGRTCYVSRTAHIVHATTSETDAKLVEAMEVQ